MAVRDCKVREICRTACQQCVIKADTGMPKEMKEQCCAGCCIHEMRLQLDTTEKARRRIPRGTGSLPKELL